MKLPEVDAQSLIRFVTEKAIAAIVTCLTVIAGAAALVMAYLAVRLTYTIILILESSFKGAGL